MSVCVCVCVCLCAEAKGGIKSQHTHSYPPSCSEPHCLSCLSPLHTSELLHTQRHTHTHTHTTQSLRGRISQYLTRLSCTGRKKEWKSSLRDIKIGHKDLEKFFFFLFLFFSYRWIQIFANLLGQTKQAGIFFLFFFFLFSVGLLDLDWARSQ